MSKAEEIKQKAVMILNDIAFGFSTVDGHPRLVAVNLKNIKQTATFLPREKERKKDFQLVNSALSEANTYKTMIIVEKNKAYLLEELNKWENTQRKK